MKKRLLVGVILLSCFIIFTSYPASAQEAIAGDSAAAVPQALSTGSGVLHKAIFLSESAQKANNSINDWINAFNTEVTLGGAGDQCIEMRYSGEVKMTGFYPRRMQFRAVVDGVLAKGGAPFLDLIDPEIYTSTAFNWWACGLTPGTHTVKIQFGPYFEDGTSYVRNRTLTIAYGE